MTPEGPRFRTVPGLRATVFLDEEKRLDGRPLTVVLVELAREAGVRTVVVSKGMAGFGRRRVIQTVDVERLHQHLPLTVECVDEPERVERLVARLRALSPDAVVEVQRTALVRRA